MFGWSSQRKPWECPGFQRSAESTRYLRWWYSLNWCSCSTFGRHGFFVSHQWTMRTNSRASLFAICNYPSSGVDNSPSVQGRNPHGYLNLTAISSPVQFARSLRFRDWGIRRREIDRYNFLWPIITPYVLDLVHSMLYSLGLRSPQVHSRNTPGSDWAIGTPCLLHLL